MELGKKDDEKEMVVADADVEAVSSDSAVYANAMAAGLSLEEVITIYY